MDESKRKRPRLTDEDVDRILTEHQHERWYLLRGPNGRMINLPESLYWKMKANMEKKKEEHHE